MLAAGLSIVLLAACSSGSSGSTAHAKASSPAATASPSPAAVTLSAQSVNTILAALPAPATSAGLTYSPVITQGTSALGDLGSGAWNISHRDARGDLQTWGSTLYVFPSATGAKAASLSSPAPAHFCPAARQALPGFATPGAVTVAVVCESKGGPATWWTVIDQADRLTYLVLATSGSSRADAVAIGRSAFTSLSALGRRVNVELAGAKPDAHS